MMQTGGDEPNYPFGLLGDKPIISWNYSGNGPPAGCVPIANEWIEATAVWIPVRHDDSGLTFGHDASVISSRPISRASAVSFEKPHMTRAAAMGKGK
jgi:hypothetical protein